MNIKIKSTGVYCLLGDFYDKTYTAIKNKYGDGENQLLAERVPGYGYLQWELPGNGWKKLTDCDPLMAAEVRKELASKKDIIRKGLGNDNDLAEKILSVPEESYIFYKPSESGKLLIRLTAWGYKYPEIVEGNNVEMVLPKEEYKENVILNFNYAGKPIGNKNFLLNGFERITDTYGHYEVGALPLGYQFDVEINGIKQHVIVQKEKGNITIDLTRYAQVCIRALIGDKPYKGVVVTFSYDGNSSQLTCNEQGVANVKIPLALRTENNTCAVSIDKSTLTKPLEEGDNEFVFRIDPPHISKKAVIEIHVKREAKPVPNAEVSLLSQGMRLSLVCDSDGKVSKEITISDDSDNIYTASVEGKTIEKKLSEGINPFIFELEPIKRETLDPQTDDDPTEINPEKEKEKVTQRAEIMVKVTRDGAAYKGADVVIFYLDRRFQLLCDEQGIATLPLDIEGVKQNSCSVNVFEQIQERIIQEGTNVFEFQFHTNVKKSSWWTCLVEFLLALLLGVLTYITFCFGGGMLFG